MRKVDNLREAHGVSEDEYVGAYKDLTKLYEANELTPEKIVSWASVKPFMVKSQEIVKSFEKHLDPSEVDKFISDVAITMRDNPKITEADIRDLIAKELDLDSDLKELEKKVIKRSESKENFRYGKESEIETFDDFF